MTARLERLTDDEILERLAARLGRVDAELPRIARWHGERASRLRVVRARRAPAALVAPSAGSAVVRPSLRLRTEPVLLLAAVFVLAVVVAGRWTPLPSGIPAVGSSASDAAATATPSAVASALVAPAPSTGPDDRSSQSAATPTPALDPVAAAVRVLQGRLGWPCAVLVRVADEPLADGLVRKLAATEHLDGFVPGVLGPIWAGDDPDAAARAFKGRLLSLDAEGLDWIVRGADSRVSAVRLLSQGVSGGTRLWRTGDVLWPVDCRTAVTDVKSLLADGRAADWPVTGEVVDVGVVRLPADPPSRPR